MNLKSLLLIVMACASGFLGGTLASQRNIAAASPTVIRASRFELVNGAGAVVASWELDLQNEVHLRFFPDGEHARVEVSASAGGPPVVRMRGRDGKDRIVLELNSNDKPMLGMGDERWEGRVVLGFTEPDFPTPEWDNWGLRFHAFGSEKTVAGIGTMQTKGGPVEGFLTISGKRIK